MKEELKVSEENVFGIESNNEIKNSETFVSYRWAESLDIIEKLFLFFACILGFILFTNDEPGWGLGIIVGAILGFFTIKVFIEMAINIALTKDNSEKIVELLSKKENK